MKRNRGFKRNENGETFVDYDSGEELDIDKDEMTTECKNYKGVRNRNW